jgi:mono/diheme cytochrome c family protein
VDASGRKAKPMERLIARQPGGCLGTKPKPGVPKFGISDRQRVVILAMLGNQASLTEPLTPEQQITRTMTALNCYSCHARERRGGVDPLRREYFTGSIDLGDEGRMPPTLRGVGAKLRTEEIKDVLVNGGSTRPYMATRMPIYGAGNVAHLPELFEQEDARPEALPTLEAHDRALAVQGRQLVGAGGLNCIGCHNFNGHPSPGVPGLDLAVNAPKLKWDWFRRYLLEPQSVRSGTRMPAFWPEGKATNKEVLAGDAEKQILAIWTYLTQKDFVELPPGLPPAKKVN